MTPNLRPQCRNVSLRSADGGQSKRGAKASLSCMHGLHEYEVVEDLGHAAHAQCRNCGKKVTAVA